MTELKTSICPACGYSALPTTLAAVYVTCPLCSTAMVPADGEDYARHVAARVDAEKRPKAKVAK